MRTDNSNSLNKAHYAYKQNKIKAFRNQIQKVKECFFRNPKTMLIVSDETGMTMADVYKYVSILRNSNQIAIAKIDLCKVSKRRSTYLTTDPALFPLSNQIKNVDDGK